MKIFGANDFSAKPNVGEAAQKDRAAAGVKQTAANRPVEEVGQQGRAAAAQANDAQSLQKADNAVVLSATASRFTEVSNEQQSARSERLAEVKKLMDEGGYDVDFDQLADKLLDEEMARKA